MQPIAKDPLVTEERVLGAGVMMVARLLLPLTSANFANASDDPVSRATSSTSSLRGLDRRHNDVRASTDCSAVQRTAVVGTVADDPTDLAWHAIDEVHANATIINARTSQSLTDDHAMLTITEKRGYPIIGPRFTESPDSGS